VPVMNFRWGREGYLASVIFLIFEHVHDINNLRPPRTAAVDQPRRAAHLRVKGKRPFPNP
jgi:hypothetical protein